MLKLREPFAQKVHLHIRQDMLKRLWDKYVPASSPEYEQIQLIYLDGETGRRGRRPEQVQLLLNLVIQNKRMQLNLSQSPSLAKFGQKQMEISLKRMERYYETQLKSCDFTMFRTVKQYFALLEQAKTEERRYQSWQNTRLAIEKQREEYRLLSLFSVRLREYSAEYSVKAMRAMEKELIRSLTETEYRLLAEDIIWKERQEFLAYLKECDEVWCRKIFRRLEKEKSIRQVLHSIRKHSARENLVEAAERMGQKEFCLLYHQITEQTDTVRQKEVWKKSRTEMLRFIERAEPETLSEIWLQMEPSPGQAENAETIAAREKNLHPSAKKSVRQMKQALSEKMEELREHYQREALQNVQEQAAVMLEKKTFQKIAGIVEAEQLMQEFRRTESAELQVRHAGKEIHSFLWNSVSPVLGRLEQERTRIRERIEHDQARAFETYRKFYPQALPEDGKRQEQGQGLWLAEQTFLSRHRREVTRDEVSDISAWSQMLLESFPPEQDSQIVGKELHPEEKKGESPIEAAEPELVHMIRQINRKMEEQNKTGEKVILSWRESLPENQEIQKLLVHVQELEETKRTELIKYLADMILILRQENLSWETHNRKKSDEGLRQETHDRKKSDEGLRQETRDRKKSDEGLRQETRDRKKSDEGLRQDRTESSEPALRMSEEEFAERISGIEDRTIAKELLKAENRSFAEQLLRIEDRTIAKELLKAENRIFSQKLLKTENKEFAQELLKTENREIAEQLLQTENREIAEQLLHAENKGIAEFLIRTENKELSEKLLRIENRELTENLLRIENREVTENLLRAENRELTENLLRIENRELTENLLRIENREVTENLLRAENRELTENLLRIENRELTENLLRIENREVTESLLRIENRVLARNLLQPQNQRFAEKLLQIENREFTEKLLQVENREFTEKLFRIENREFAEKLFRIENREFAEKLLQSASKELAEVVLPGNEEKIPGISYWKLWEWSEALLAHPEHGQDWEDADILSGRQQEVVFTEEARQENFKTQVIRRQIEMAKDRNHLQRLMRQLNHRTNAELVYRDAQLRMPQIQELLSCIRGLDEEQYGVLVKELSEITGMQTSFSAGQNPVLPKSSHSGSLEIQEIPAEIVQKDMEEEKQISGTNSVPLDHRKGRGYLAASYTALAQRIQELETRRRLTILRDIQKAEQALGLPVFRKKNTYNLKKKEAERESFGKMTHENYNRQYANIEAYEDYNEENLPSGEEIKAQRYLPSGEEIRVQGYLPSGEEIRAQGYLPSGEEIRAQGYLPSGEEIRVQGYLPSGEAIRAIEYPQPAEETNVMKYPQASEEYVDMGYLQAPEEINDMKYHQAPEETNAIDYFQSAEETNALQYLQSAEAANPMEYLQMSGNHAAEYRGNVQQPFYPARELEYTIQKTSTLEEEQQRTRIRMEEETAQIKSAQEQLDKKLKEVEQQLKKTENAMQDKEDAKSFAEQVKKQLYEELHVEKLRRGLV